MRFDRLPGLRISLSVDIGIEELLALGAIHGPRSGYDRARFFGGHGALQRYDRSAQYGAVDRDCRSPHPLGPRAQ